MATEADSLWTPWTAQTVAGVTVTPRPDGSTHVAGTGTANASADSWGILLPGTYRTGGTVALDGYRAYVEIQRYLDGTMLWRGFQGPQVLTIDQPTMVRYMVRWAKGVTLDATIHPTLAPAG